jgi:hypothetical protein
MNKRQRKKREYRQFEKEYGAYKESLKKLPSWYWKHGLHDAHILEALELGDGIDKKRGKHYKNCLVLSLDSSGAMYEFYIKKIIFYNYEVRMADASVASLSKTWWLSDTVEQLPGGNYLLNLEVDPENGDRWNFSIEFEYVDVEGRLLR